MAWLYLAFNPVASCPLAPELLLIGAFLLAQYGNHTRAERQTAATGETEKEGGSLTTRDLLNQMHVQ